MSGPPPVPGGRSDRDRDEARRARAARRSGTRGAVADVPRPRAAPPPRINRRGRIVLAVLALLGIVVLWFVVSLFQPFHGSGKGSVAVTIPRNSGVTDIANLLESKGVVSSAFFFEARATLAGKRGDLKPGSYELKKDMSYSTALDILAKGPPANTVTLVIPEGRSRQEIAPTVKSLEGSYLAATKRSRLLNPARYGAKNAHDLEGFLFPASFQLKRGQSVDALVAKQLAAFKREFATIDLRAARKVNLTPYDVLVIASLVERETASAHERRLIASVIYNRLKDGIPLGIDATTRFQYDDWDKPLTEAQLQSSSPYNTRNHRGLPPGPIGNPGLASLEAAAHPAHSGYLYYVANPCKPGTHTFVRTNAEFNAAVAKYDAARAKAGGNAPKGC